MYVIAWLGTGYDVSYESNYIVALVWYGYDMVWLEWCRYYMVSHLITHDMVSYHITSTYLVYYVYGLVSRHVTYGITSILRTSHHIIPISYKYHVKSFYMVSRRILSKSRISHHSIPISHQHHVTLFSYNFRSYSVNIMQITPISHLYYTNITSQHFHMASHNTLSIPYTSHACHTHFTPLSCHFTVSIIKITPYYLYFTNITPYHTHITTTSCHIVWHQIISRPYHTHHSTSHQYHATLFSCYIRLNHTITSTSLSYKITPYYVHVTYITVHHTHITSTSRYISLCHTTFQIALTLCSHHVQRTHLTPTSCHIIFVLYHTISHTHNAHHRYITPKYHRHHQQDMT